MEGLQQDGALCFRYEFTLFYDSRKAKLYIFTLTMIKHFLERSQMKVKGRRFA